MTAPKPAAMQGATAQDAAICETLDFFHPQLTEMSEAMPTPTKAPTMDWVVLTGKPKRVQTVNHVAEPDTLSAGKGLGLHARLQWRTNFGDNVCQDQHSRRFLERCN